MSTLKFTTIVIILAAYQLFQCAYAEILSNAVVKCINGLAAHFKVPTPYTPGLTDELYADLLLTSTKIDFPFKPYLDEEEDHYKGTVTLSKSMMVKCAIAHLKSPQYVDFTNLQFLQLPIIPDSEPQDIFTEYYYSLFKELISVGGVQTPEEFCTKTVNIMMNMFQFTYMETDCITQLQNFPQDLRQRALEYGYINATISEFNDLYFGELYMKHLITKAQVLKFIPMMRNLEEPEDYCKTKTGSVASSSSGN